MNEKEAIEIFENQFASEYNRLNFREASGYLEAIKKAKRLEITLEFVLENNKLFESEFKTKKALAQWKKEK